MVTYNRDIRPAPHDMPTQWARWIEQAFQDLTSDDDNNTWTNVTVIENTTTENITINNTVTLGGFTEGSVLFAGVGGEVTEDNANFFWDDTNDYLGILTNTPSYPIHVGGEVRFDDTGYLGDGLQFDTITPLPTAIPNKVVLFDDDDRLYLSRPDGQHGGDSNDFSGSEVEALWYFEDDGSGGVDGTDSTGNGNRVVGGLAALDTVNYKQGSASYRHTTTVDWMGLGLAFMSSNFPLKGGTSNDAGTWSMWFRRTGAPAAFNYIFLHGRGAGLYSLALYFIGDATVWAFQSSDGTTTENWSTGMSLVVDQWYLITVTYDDSTKTHITRIWDDTAGALLGTHTHVCAGNINIANGDFYVGNQVLVALGNHDQFAVFNTVLTPTEIDRIANNSYPSGGGWDPILTEYSPDMDPIFGDVTTDSVTANDVPLLPGSPTVNAVVAASDSSANIIATSDYQCDGTADEVQINAAITAVAAAGGGTVLLAAGNYEVAASIQIKDDITLAGSGLGTKIIFNTAVGDDVLIENADATHYSRSATPNYRIVLRDMYIDGDKANRGVGTPAGTVAFSTVENVLVENVTIVNGWNAGIRTEFSDTVNLINVVSESSGDDCIAINEETVDCKVLGCTARGAGDAGKSAGTPNGIEAQDGARAVTIANCYVADCDLGSGIAVGTHVGKDPGIDIVIANNIVDDCPTGIELNGRSGQLIANVSVTGNQIKNEAVGTIRGIKVHFSDKCLIANNTIINESGGMRFNDDVTNLTVTGNLIQSSGTTAWNYGMMFEGDTLTDCIFSDNQIIGWDNGVRIYSGCVVTDCLWTDNQIIDSGVGGAAAFRWGDTSSDSGNRLQNNNLQGTNAYDDDAVGIGQFPTTGWMASGNHEQTDTDFVIRNANICLAEGSAASASTAGRGQIWIKNDSPNTAWFTDDTGVDHQLGVGGGGGMTYKYIKATAQAEGDLNLSDAVNWAVDKALIHSVRVVTASTNWSMWLLQNDNGYAANDATIPMLKIANEVEGNANLYVNTLYEDEDASNEVHLYWVSESGVDTATIIIQALEAE